MRAGERDALLGQEHGPLELALVDGHLAVEVQGDAQATFVVQRAAQRLVLLEAAGRGEVALLAGRQGECDEVPAQGAAVPDRAEEPQALLAQCRRFGELPALHGKPGGGVKALGAQQVRGLAAAGQRLLKPVLPFRVKAACPPKRLQEHSQL
jgi:hypothetical protein